MNVARYSNTIFLCSSNRAVLQPHRIVENRKYRVTPKSKPLPKYQNIVLNRIKACQWDYIYSLN